MQHESAHDALHRLIASLSNPILLMSVGVGLGVRDTEGLKESFQDLTEELTTPVGVYSTQLQLPPCTHVLVSGLDSSGCLTFGVEEISPPKAAVVIHNGQPVMLAT